MERRALVIVLRVHPPGLALDRAEQPAAPFALARRLMAEELDPGERARVLDVGGIRADGGADLADGLVVEREVGLGLVRAEPGWRLIAPCGGFGRHGGRCVGVCARVWARG